MALTGYERLLRHNAKKKDIKDKANAIVKEKIRRITNRDIILYNSLFAYPVIKKFGINKGMGSLNIILILLMDLHPIFTIKESRLWGFETGQFYKITNALKEQGYTDCQQGFQQLKKHFLTLKGKLVVKEFNEYYDKRVRQILRKDGIGDNETIRKVTRVQPARIYKPVDQFAGNKPPGISKREHTKNSNRSKGLE